MKRSKWIIKSLHYKHVLWELSKLNGFIPIKKYNLVWLNKLDYTLHKELFLDVTTEHFHVLQSFQKIWTPRHRLRNTENSGIINYETFHIKMYILNRKIIVDVSRKKKIFVLYFVKNKSPKPCLMNTTWQRVWKELFDCVEMKDDYHN